MRTQVQTFRYQEIHRSQILPAPYNPRIITEDALDRLRANLARVGLLTTLVWNARSGHLVGGHHRLGVLDALEGSTDYRLGVAVVDLDDQRERELNVFLNNTWAQGEFDTDQLMTLIADAGGTADVIAAMGWAPAEMLLEYGARDELAAIMPTGEGVRRRTAQDTLGPHVMVIFRNNLDKERFLRHLGRDDGLRRLEADEICDYIRADRRWRAPAA